MEFLETIILLGSALLQRLFRPSAWNFDEVFLRVWDLSLGASLVIAVVLLLRVGLRKMPRICSYCLWAVVLFRLLCPVGIDAEWGILPAFDTAESYTLANDEVSFSGAVDAAVHAVGDAANGDFEPQLVRTRDHGSVTSQWWEIWILLGKYIWAAGMTVMILYACISYIRLKKKLRLSIPLVNEHWSDGCLKPVKPNVFLADGISTAFVVGLLRPKIYLPSGLRENERSYILLHEQHHIKRADHIWKLLGFIALCIHWFNPLVWVAFVEACKDMEMSCDEAVVRQLEPDIRKEYAASLLHLTAGKQVIPVSPAFGEGETGDRVRRVLRYRKPVFVLTALTAAGVVIVSLLLVPNRTSGSDAVAAIYKSDMIVYNTDGPGGPVDNGPRFCITGDYQLYRQNDGEVEWTCFGQLEPYSLDKQELKQYTVSERSWTTSYRLRDITDSYILRLENDLFYLLFRMKNGDTLIGFGWEDMGERWEGYSDDTSLRVLYRLQPEQQTDAVMHMTMRSLLGESITYFASHVIDSYIIFAFQSGDENQHLGYAVFQTYSRFALQEYADSVKLLEWHFYENAGLETMYGIYVCPDPAVLSDDGTMTNKNTYDVVLNQYGYLDRVVQTVKVEGQVHHTVEQSEINGRRLILLNWAQTDAPKPHSVSLQFYDGAGHELGYGSLSSEERILKVFADDPDFAGMEPERWVLAEDAAYDLQGVILCEDPAGRVQFVFIREDRCYPVGVGENGIPAITEETALCYVGEGTVQATLFRDGEMVTMQISFSKTETGIHYKAEELTS